MHFVRALHSAHGACFHFSLRETLCTKSLVWSHGPVVGEGLLAAIARLARSAATMVALFELSAPCSEVSARFHFAADGALEWPDFRCAVVAQLLPLGVVAQLPHRESVVAAVAHAKAEGLLELARLLIGAGARWRFEAHAAHSQRSPPDAAAM